jgi:predicted ArsR family transcriptional regulator
VAAEFPALCDAEAEAFSRLLGTHVTRLATLAHGDGVCTTLVPRIPLADAGFPDVPHRTTTEVRS